jgi:pyrroline-5-carboxylate reductase
MKIAIIGAGNMGSAMIGAWLDKKVCKPDDILVCDRHPEKLKTLHVSPRTLEKVLCETIIPNSKLKNRDFVVLAVKPADILSVAQDIKPYLSKKTIVVSIAAGIEIKKIQSVLRDAKIVRAMPNMPAQIGMGMVGWATKSRLSSKEKADVHKLLGSLGYDIYFDKEESLNAVTAISGSGAAYVFYFMEALYEAAKKIGLKDEEAKHLTLGTFIGSSVMTSLTELSPSDLRAKVTSKGGTTEAAIKVFDERKLKKIVSDAVNAAYNRAKQLSK